MRKPFFLAFFLFILLLSASVVIPHHNHMLKSILQSEGIFQTNLGTNPSVDPKDPAE